MILPREAVYSAWGFTITLAHQGPLWQVILETPLGTLGAFWEGRLTVWGEWSWEYDRPCPPGPLRYNAPVTSP